MGAITLLKSKTKTSDIPAPVCQGEFYSTPPSDHVVRYEWGLRELVAFRFRRLPSAVMTSDRPSELGAGLRILDVGCGSGYGLEMYRDAGFTAVGIDNNIDAVAYSRQRAGIDVHHGRYPEDAGLLPPPFGISMFEVIEHNLDGMAMLRHACQSALIVVASVPYDEVPGSNAYHVLFGLTPDSFSWMDPPPTFFLDEACPSSMLLMWQSR